ncbi:pentatricopeptide repeat-containing protein [Pyrus ussuriensis x Pyrus communis]|uniref:Pentatricopeptide repeat-containing protein n=1 Tax=Pyrus ussuriensis x Pyrus communis TaxID=2448454 RepID=A0A5N5EVX1_9ROSA|nr:pentatricopeptide repeat-containing protein [Pyrus ussuriensis x Pyrus communis]
MPLSQLFNMLRLKISAKPSPLLHSITTVSYSSSASISTPTPTVDFLHFYTVTPPIQPWPRRLYPKRLISLIAHQPNLDLALQIFHHASKFHPGFSHNYHNYHAILNRLSRSRAFHPMIDPLLSDLKNSQIQCSEDIFITLIRNFGVLGLLKLAFKAFLEALNALLNALVQNNECALVHSVLKNCGQRFGVRPNLSTRNILIKALRKKNDVETALKVLDEMPAMGFVRNVVTYTMIIGGYVLRGDMVGAKRVFGQILDAGWYSDATTYTVLMDGFVKQGKLVDAVKVMDDIEENKVGANEVTYGVMVEAYCKGKRYIPSSALCCKVIDGLCREGKVEDGSELWKKLLKKNCSPDNAISSTLMHWFCEKGNVWEAKKLFDQLGTDSIPSVMTYSMLIAEMCEVGELCEAGRLWDDMVEKGCAPIAFMYSMLIKGFSEAEVAKVVSMAMSSGDTNIASWGLFVTRFVGDLDTGESLLDKILLKNVQHTLIGGGGAQAS